MKVSGKGGISATIIADSVSSVNEKRITTFELEYPRFIHAEFMTHRMFSRNAASSRAIPVEKVLGQVTNNPAMPIHWGKNQKGMQAQEELDQLSKEGVELDWKVACNYSLFQAGSMQSKGAHKQIINRILEPYQFIKVVCTATEFDNFFWLRCHADAQPEIGELADCMYKARQQNTVFIQELNPGEWHVPYVDYTKTLGYTIPVDGDYENGRIDLTVEEALQISSSCCAQVSYRILDQSLDKAKKIYKMLVESKPVHASPFEHQATPIENKLDWWETKGATHIDKHENVWSGNFKSWIQHRQLIENNTCWEYNP